jgi:ribonuclease J
MAPQLTCYGGVGEIGGNKFLLQDGDTKVMLDFGTGFSDGAEYFDSGISPRPVNLAGDLFEFDLLPRIPGLYGEKALSRADLKYQKPDVDAILLTHYHWDHMGRIGLVDEEIPVYCGETTAMIHDANSEATGSPLDGHPLKTFRTGDKLRIGSLEVEPIHVDHSIPGAYGFIVHTSEGALAYTGDFRFHGPAGSMTNDFISAAKETKPAVLLTEGTRVSLSDRRDNTSEEAVLKEAKAALGGTRRLVFSTFRGNDTDRINTFHSAAAFCGRRLAVSMKTALLLEKLAADPRLKVPRVGRDVDVYVRRKKSGRLDDSDYYAWERRFLSGGLSAEDVRRRQGEVFLHLEVWNFPELIDIRPEKGGKYIHAASEAFNEEGEKEDAVIRNWVRHLGFEYRQLHASGHAPMGEVGRLVHEVGARKVVPIHTEHPELFVRFRRGTRMSLAVPVKGKPVPIP